MFVLNVLVENNIQQVVRVTKYELVQTLEKIR